MGYDLNLGSMPVSFVGIACISYNFVLYKIQISLVISELNVNGFIFGMK